MLLNPFAMKSPNGTEDILPKIMTANFLGNYSASVISSDIVNESCIRLLQRTISFC